MWYSAMLMEVSESMVMLFMPLVRALTMVVNAVFDLVDEGLIVNDDVCLELDHGLDQVVHVVIALVDGGLIVNDDVGLALDHGLDQVVHAVIDHVDGGLSVHSIDIGIDITNQNHYY